jgi:hypothetical protein
MDLYFSSHFGLAPDVVQDYGAFDVSVITDLPLFIDPFLLFNSEKEEYQALHSGILRYLAFLRDKAAVGDLSGGLVQSLFRFKEVKQNWLGFCVLGNEGHALGAKFATALYENLGSIFSDFGTEQVTRASHLEKLTLLSGNVGRDGISDFTTNLIKEFLLEYTQTFADRHLSSAQTAEFRVAKVRFNYETETWEARNYRLPVVREDFVLLTPMDILTRDETWISSGDMMKQFHRIPLAMPNEELRAHVNNYFQQQLPREPRREDIASAMRRTVLRYPELLDYYIRLKEDTGDEARAVSAEKVKEADALFVRQLQQALADVAEKTDFYKLGYSSYDEALKRVHAFKDYIENKDGYRLINAGNGKPFSKETDVQLYFGVIWFGSAFDVNREPNNGRGPVDFKVSIGASDKALIEFKLASNSKLKQNLANQVEVYEKANDTKKSIKVVVCYTAEDEAKVAKVLSELKLVGKENVVVIDARSDNKPSASNVKSVGE